MCILLLLIIISLVHKCKRFGSLLKGCRRQVFIVSITIVGRTHYIWEGSLMSAVTRRSSFEWGMPLSDEACLPRMITWLFRMRHARMKQVSFGWGMSPANVACLLRMRHISSQPRKPRVSVGDTPHHRLTLAFVPQRLSSGGMFMLDQYNSVPFIDVFALD